MSTFKKLNTRIFSKTNAEVSADIVNWKNYTAPVLIKEFGPIDYIDFSPTEPHHFAVTCSCRVQIYNPITKLVTKNINKFKETAYGATFRKDGRLLCVGGDEAIVRLFDVHTRSSLRVFNGHAAPVHRTFFTSDGMRIVSFSDDKSSTVWDIPSEKQLFNYAEHTDYIRAGAVCPVSPDIFVSGSYDRTANMYDTRTNKKVFSVHHDAPIESILFLPTGGIFLTAGGTEIRIWDCLTNGRLLAKISQHHKTITSLQIACNGRRILSGSLDRHIKIYDAGTYKMVHSLDYPNSILSMGMSADNQTIVAGMTDGMISIKQKEATEEKIVNRQKMSHRYAGKTTHILNVDTYVHEVSKEMMSKHDACLRKFQYSKALDCVMKSYVSNKTPHITVALFQELIRRQGLVQALAGRDGKSLVNISKFIIRHVSDVRFSRVMLYTMEVLLDIYEDNLEELNLETRAVFHILAKKLQEEQELILSLSALKGGLEMILSAAETTATFNNKKESSFLPSAKAQKNLILSVS